MDNSQDSQPPSPQQQDLHGQPGYHTPDEMPSTPRLSQTPTAMPSTPRLSPTPTVFSAMNGSPSVLQLQPNTRPSQKQNALEIVLVLVAYFIYFWYVLPILEEPTRSASMFFLGWHMHACVYLALSVNARGCVGFAGLKYLIRAQTRLDGGSAVYAYISSLILAALPLSHTVVIMMLAVAAVYLPNPLLLGALFQVLVEWKTGWVGRLAMADLQRRLEQS